MAPFARKALYLCEAHQMKDTHFISEPLCPSRRILLSWFTQESSLLAIMQMIACASPALFAGAAAMAVSAISVSWSLLLELRRRIVERLTRTQSV